MVSEIVFGLWWKILFADNISDSEVLMPKNLDVISKWL